MDMSHNNLSKIDRSVFVNLLSLRHMILLNNSLTKLESSTFGKLVTLLTLDISHNKLTKVRRGVFQGKHQSRIRFFSSHPRYLQLVTWLTSQSKPEDFPRASTEK